MDSLPPKSISDNLLNSIGKALQEEKVPAWKRFIKVALWTLIVGFLSLLPFVGVLGTDEKFWPVVSCFFWMTLLGTGFFMYFRPQPRLAVPGYWSSWVYAKVIIGATLGTILTFLICPSFSFVPTTLSWNPLDHITMQLMSVGGMTLCMLFCGCLFSVLIASFAFLSTARTLLRTRFTKVLALSGIVLIAQVPIIIYQIMNPGLRTTVAYWVIGSIVGALLTVLLIRQLASVRERSKSIR